jgi:hypothetical protein
VCIIITFFFTFLPRSFLACRETSGNIAVTVGRPWDAPLTNPKIFYQPGPSKKNPTSVVHNMLLELPPVDAAPMKLFHTWLIEEALRVQLLGPGITTLDAMKANLFLPFSYPNAADGDGALGVWVSMQMQDPKGYPGLRTQFDVTKSSAPNMFETIRPYNGHNLLKDQNLCCMFELGEMKEFAGNHRLSALCRTCFIDESQAFPDDAVVSIPRSGSSKGMAMPYNDGYILFGSEEYPTPVWVSNTHDLNGFKQFIDISTFRKRYEERKIQMVAVNSDTPPGSKRYFFNDESIKGNIFVYEGDFGAPDEEQPFLLGDPQPHKDSAPGSTTFGALTAITNKDHIDDYLSIAEMTLADASALKMFTAKNGDSWSIERLRGEFALPGKEPEKDGEHFFIWQKFQMQPPKSIDELQTKFYVISSPGEPWSCELIDGTTVGAGRRVMTGFEWSELKKTTGKMRAVLYTKVVFVSNQTSSASSNIIAWGSELPKVDATRSEKTEGSDTTDEPSSSKRARVDGKESPE